MSAPVTDLASSISSSGHTDGLGRRLLMFDRETGAMRERLYLRPELSAFEAPLRRRVQLLTTFDDERFARPFGVQRDPATGELTVISEFIAGSRLSDLIETAQEASCVPGVDAALGFLLEVLPALSTFHSVLAISHGLIDPTRIFITPAGQVVLLDTSFGEVVERLTLSHARLWIEFGIAAPQSAGRVRLDVAADLCQVAMSAVTLVLGRRLRVEEFPDALSSTLMEVVEVAQIRGNTAFASGLQQMLQRCLPFPGRHSYQKTDELLTELRKLVRHDIGEDVCRQALIEFLEQMDAVCEAPRDEVQGRTAEPPVMVRKHESPTVDLTSTLNLLAADESNLTMRVGIVDVAGAGDLQDHAMRFVDEEEISLDDLAIAGPVGAEAADRTAAQPEFTERARAAAEVPAQPGRQVESPALAPRKESPPPESMGLGPAAAAAAADTPRVEEPQGEAAPGVTSPAQPPAHAESRIGWSRLRKRQRSARERKDKLRSTTGAQQIPAAKQPIHTARSSPWIVSPAKAAAFEPVGEQAAIPPALADGGGTEAPQFSPGMAGVPMPQFPAVPVVAPAPAAMALPPVPPPPAPAITAGRAGQPVPINHDSVPTRRAKQAATTTSGLRIKPEAPPGFRPPRTTETISALPYAPQGPLFGSREPNRFPWRLAATVIVVVAAAVVAGRAHLPSRAVETDAAAAAAPVEPPVVVAPQPESGEIVVRSQPAGVRVLLDGKAVGETPLKLTAVSTGRHVLTFVSTAGEVTRAVRVTAGQALEVDVPVFSGWLAVFAPVVLDVSLNGRSVGTTEQNRLMLPPGRHKVTLTNRELGYRAVQTVDIEPGEVRSVTVEPRGRVNLNANPWAEVWLDGQKLGDTPLADLPVPVGVREFVFRHPEHGERRATATVRADRPTAVSIDFGRSPFE